MLEIWRRIETSLGASAPDLLARLPDGASAASIDAIEKLLGFELPADVRESYLVHDGSGGAGILPQDDYGRVNGVEAFSLKEAFDERAMWVKLLNMGEFKGNRANPKGPIKEGWWNPLWLPVTSNGGGDHLCIDLDPAPGGEVGQVIDFSHETGPRSVVAPGWRAFLEGYAAELEAGRLTFDSDGELVATDEET
jgi:cell wall assembly regulator SMI1